ncbi:MAG: endonuclease/exonuclease/phosphatase family protein, partial [Pseudomonadota bacterium]
MAGPEIARGLIAALALLAALPAAAETVRVASFNTALSAGGPGLLLDALRRGRTEKAETLTAILLEVRPDILVLQEVDHDAAGATLAALAGVLEAAGLDYPHRYTAPVNTGQPSGVDLNGDGDPSGPADAYGFGRFPGQYGMAVLSRYPIRAEAARSFALLRWADFPEHVMPVAADGTPWPTAEAAAVMRLSSKSHWDLPVALPGGDLHLLISHPTPPVFDGPEDLNGRRNHDEIAFWTRYLDGWAAPDDAGVAVPFAGPHFVILGDLNADPEDGDGRREAIRALLAHPRLQDPAPEGAGGVAAAGEGVNARHRGDPARDTADWNDTRGPGNLRVDFVLPSATLEVTGAGVFWPAPGAPGHALVAGGRDASSDHRLVWADSIAAILPYCSARSSQ